MPVKDKGEGAGDGGKCLQPSSLTPVQEEEEGAEGSRITAKL